MCESVKAFKKKTGSNKIMSYASMQMQTSTNREDILLKNVSS